MSSSATRTSFCSFSSNSRIFAWASVNYAPVMVIGVLLLLIVWWNVSAKTWFTGPVRTIDEEPTEPAAA